MSAGRTMGRRVGRRVRAWLGALWISAFGCGTGGEVGRAARSNGGAETRTTENTARAPTAAPSGDRQETGSSRNAQEPPIRRDGTIYGETEMMGTRVSINLWLPPGRSAVEARDAMEAAFGEMDRIERIASEWKDDTELSRLNRLAARGPVRGLRLSDDLFRILGSAQAVSEATGGAFDVTFHGVGRLWTFTPGARPPDPRAIARALGVVGFRYLVLDPEAKTISIRKAGVQIGLGAIAKGYAVDRASQVLRNAGFADHIVEAGGDTYVSGTKGGRPWVVGVQDPFGPGPVGVLQVRDRAVVTSGDYQRYFEHEGHRYAHILDPRSGWPIPESIAPHSVTVVAPDATTADAFATAVAVMGVEDGLRFVEEQGHLEAVVIGRDGLVRTTSGLEGIYRPVDHAAGGRQRSERPRRGTASVARRERGLLRSP